LKKKLLWVHYAVHGEERSGLCFFVETIRWCSGFLIEVRMIKVKSRGNETVEQTLRRFKKMCEKEGLTKDIKRVAYYEKPSEKRRRRQRKGGPRPTSMSRR
jgi:small subunit ribosomal protein S21